MSQPPDDRPPMVLAMEWATRVTTIALEMALPGLAGYWLDQRLSTGWVLTAVGAVLGLALGMWSLVKIAVPRRAAPDNRPNNHESAG